MAKLSTMVVFFIFNSLIATAVDASCGGDPNAHSVTCTNRCKQSCNTKAVCLNYCADPSCACNEGYRLNQDIKKCVLIKDCPNFVAETFSAEESTAFGYHQKIGIPLAARIREAEAVDQLIPGSQGMVGRANTDISQVPYLVGLIIQIPFSLTSVCDGTLIAPNRVLTAAHCYFDGIITAQSFTIVYGSNFLFNGGFRTTTTDVITHPDWMPDDIENDIAILTVSVPPEDPVVRPVHIVTSFYGTTALASGRGFPTKGGNIDLRLSAVTLPIITNAECAAVYGNIFVSSSTLCTSGRGGRGTCSGYSGGPLVSNITGTPTLVGVASFTARRGCENGLPVVFTRISSYLSFINSNN